MTKNLNFYWQCKHFVLIPTIRILEAKITLQSTPPATLTPSPWDMSHLSVRKLLSSTVSGKQSRFWGLDIGSSHSCSIFQGRNVKKTQTIRFLIRNHGWVSLVIVVANPAKKMKALLLVQLNYNFCRTSASSIVLCTIASFQCLSSTITLSSKNTTTCGLHILPNNGLLLMGPLTPLLTLHSGSCLQCLARKQQLSSRRWYAFRISLFSSDPMNDQWWFFQQDTLFVLEGLCSCPRSREWLINLELFFILLLSPSHHINSWHHLNIIIHKLNFWTKLLLNCMDPTKTEFRRWNWFSTVPSERIWTSCVFNELMIGFGAPIHPGGATFDASSWLFCTTKWILPLPYGLQHCPKWKLWCN